MAAKSSGLKSFLKSEGFDIAHQHGIWLPSSHRFTQSVKKCKIPLILSPRGMLQNWARHHKRIKKLIAWNAYQRNDLKKVDFFHATSLDELENIKNLVICSSTYGQGDVPDGSQSFYDFLSNSKSNLAHLRYGVFALGDMTYAETFCFGGKKFDQALSQLNAQKVIDTFCHNASDGSLPEEHAPDWAKDFLKNISEIK